MVSFLKEHYPALVIGVPLVAIITSDAIGAQLFRGMFALLGNMTGMISNDQLMAIVNWHLWSLGL
jgi:hypothetical protein